MVAKRRPLAFVILSAAALTTLPQAAFALGLGGITLQSALNEPLRARIELVNIGDADAGDFRIHLAANEAFAQAGVDRTQFLDDLVFTPHLRTAAGSYIEVTSRRSLVEPYLGFIAAYTLADALGARASGDAVAYALWLFAVNGVVAALVLRLSRGVSAFAGLGPHWRAGLAGGVMSMLAYSLVIVATTQAPIGLVSALRETSVLFALLIGVFWLHESLPLGRICAGLAIVAGVVAIKLA